MKVYVVGGAVRDELLELPVADFDYVVVGATPEQMQAQGYEAVGRDFPVFLHPKTHAEYALARTERKSGPGYTGFTCYAAPDVTLEDDLLRRDLTINAIAKDNNGKLHDPYNGIDDLHARKLRHVSPAFTEDPLRVLRVARFRARFHELGFSIADETVALMQKMVASGELESLTGERVWLETQKALLTANPEIYFQVLHRVGALNVILRNKPDAEHNPNELLLAQLQRLSGEALLDAPSKIKQQQTLQRYVLLCIDLHTELSSQLDIAEAFRVPHALKRAAEETEILYKKLYEAELNVTQLLAAFQRNDAWRRPEQFTVVLQCLQILFNGSEVKNRPDFQTLEKGFAATANIDVQEILAAGYQHREISEQLNKRREQILQKLLDVATNETKLR